MQDQVRCGRRGDTVAETASFLCRDEDEVRVKMKELGLVGIRANASLEQIRPQRD
jgi:hypothetical protein